MGSNSCFSKIIADVFPPWHRVNTHLPPKWAHSVWDHFYGQSEDLWVHWKEREELVWTPPTGGVSDISLEIVSVDWFGNVSLSWRRCLGRGKYRDLCSDCHSSRIWMHEGKERNYLSHLPTHSSVGPKTGSCPLNWKPETEWKCDQSEIISHGAGWQLPDDHHPERGGWWMQKFGQLSVLFEPSDSPCVSTARVQLIIHVIHLWWIMRE